MQTRLRRPLLAAIVTGALFAGGVAISSPALADTTDPSPSVSVDAPSNAPSDVPSDLPSDVPSTAPSDVPSDVPSTAPSDVPSTIPSTAPSNTPPSNTPPSTTPVDKTPPTGAFKLSVFSIWVGQRTTMTLLGVGDNQSTAAQITRVVNWGDGTTSTLPATQTVITKQYLKAGKFPVTLTLTDAAHNVHVYKSSGVLVTRPGKFTTSASAVWIGQKYNINISAVPAGTTKITIYWGDGYYYSFPGKNQSVPSVYYHRYGGGVMPAGPVHILATFTNKNGTSAQMWVLTETIKNDIWNPTVSITSPAHSNYVSSWKVVRGTASDKGSGIYGVWVSILKFTTAGTPYCLTGTKKWIHLTDSTDEGQCTFLTHVTGGKWSVSVPGLGQGAIWIGVTAEDQSDRYKSLDYPSQSSVRYLNHA